MKKSVFTIISLFFALTGIQAQETKSLPAPDKSVSMTLYQSLEQRRSVRQFSERELTDMQLSQILWAACGISRPDKKMITAPSASNMQDIKVYVCSKDGAWLYMPESNSLQKVSDQDLRVSLAGFQKEAAEAPVNLVLVSDQSKRNRTSRDNGYWDAGYVSQNIYLACTALGLATVARATMEAETIKSALGIGDKQFLIGNHPVGYEKGVYGFAVKDNMGEQVNLGQYNGKVMLIVNTASKCGFTPQFDGLEKLYKQYADQGLVVLGFPCNQFGGQDPGTNEEIASFCKLNYGVTFPIMDKIDVNGENAAPLFTYLKAQQGFAGWGEGQRAEGMDRMMTKRDKDYKQNPDIKWNFTKFLIDKQGNVVKRFEPTTEPADIAPFIEEELKK